MTRKQRTEEELKAALKHLIYEIEMLKGTMKHLEAEKDNKGVIYYALIESFAVHARALMHFLYPAGQIKEGDVIAKDFFRSTECLPLDCLNEPEGCFEARQRVNKEIAHLTYDRQLVASEEKKWFYNKLGNEILAIFYSFLRTLPPHLYDKSYHIPTKMRNDTTLVASTSAIESRFISCL